MSSVRSTVFATARRRRFAAGVVIAGVAMGAASVFPVFRIVETDEALRAALPLSGVAEPVVSEGTPGVAFRVSVTVSRIIDGDTVELVNGERMRLIGIDAPERGGCYAEESAALLAQFVSGRSVQWEKGVNERDRYGRLLGYLYDGSTFINLDLVRRGAAVAYPYPPDTVYAAQFSETEQRARAAKRGLWGSCQDRKDTNENPVAEPSVRDGAGANTHENNIGVDSFTPSAVEGLSDSRGSASEECVIKGNISSSGEKIYHLPGCGSYEKTVIDQGKGEQWFCTEQEAQAAGWRKAKNCS